MQTALVAVLVFLVLICGSISGISFADHQDSANHFFFTAGAVIGVVAVFVASIRR